MRRNLSKISITVPPELVANLDYVCGRTGVSRSALISELLPDAVAHMRKLLEQVPLDPTNLSGPELVRMRGDSEQVVRERLSELEGMANDLFAPR
jgi:hypothetical protein